MCIGAPTDVCMETCSKNNMPLRPIEHSFDFVNDLWGEVLSPQDADATEMFPFDLAHSGGDEVKTFCWDDDNVSAAWMDAHNLTSSETYLYFINKNIDIVASYSKRPVIWNDGFNTFTTSIDPRAVIMFWTSTSYGKYFKEAVKAGREIIAATSNPLYLSNANDYSTKLYYEYDPCDCSNSANDNNCVNTTAECSKIIGMETAFWTSDYDASNLETALWPRALALAERAWSSKEMKYYTNGSSSTGTTDSSTPATSERLGKFRCSLLERGIAVLPLFANWYHKYAGNRPGESGSCLYQ
uniref:beta-N-acetylhexosaminidase n=2 Tax=Octactis speculum TaxID=3111310 RepID=A0A7S2HCT8_9STRA|mmetsp:Transcript_63616/g.87446  ORF Transcript_63616/g.87446 Transcript_63616/m.87446 type:complete len:298 (+) Transcript_63616:27-920(+)